jgi:hypothetical protein
MRPFRITLSLGLFLAATSFMASSMAWAYIPPAPFILHTIAKKHTDYTTIRVRTSLVALDDRGSPTGPKLRETTFFNSKDESLRSWVTDETGKVLYQVERNANSGSPSLKLPVVAEVLFDTNSVRMANALKAAGVQLPSRSQSKSAADDSSEAEGANLTLHRWNRTVAWVFGKTAQFWVEKDTFVPLRIIAHPSADTELYDFQMENFRYYDELAYPRLAALYQAGKKTPILRAELIDLVMEPSSIEAPKDKSSGFTEAGEAASSQTRELIQAYYRFIR